MIDVTFLIMKESALSHLSNKDMLDNDFDISLQGQYLHVGSKRQPLFLDNCFFVQNCTADTTPFALFTGFDLRRIHRTLGYPSVRKRQKLLAGPSRRPLDKVTKKGLKKIQQDCVAGQTFARTPRRLKRTIGTERLQFIHRMVVETLFIDVRLVIHAVDESTHFAAASFLRNESEREIRRTISDIWIHTYIGPPDFLAIDQDSA